MTQTKHAPSRDWLNFVVTSKARNKIRHYLEAEEGRAVDIGRKLLEKGPAVRPHLRDAALRPDAARDRRVGDAKT